jgi:hypothetical protein
LIPVFKNYFTFGLEKVYVILLALFSTVVAFSQNYQAPCYKELFGDSQYVFTKMELHPHYKGYEEELNKFIISEINIRGICNKLPDSVKLLEDSVKIKFIMAKSGQMSNLSVKSVDTNLSEELTKVLIKSSCNWVPGYSNRDLNGWYYGTIYFKLDRRRRSLSVTISSVSN